MKQRVQFSELLGVQVSVRGLSDVRGAPKGSVTHMISLLDSSYGGAADLEQVGLVDHLVLHFDDISERIPGKRVVRREDIQALLEFGQRLAANLDQERHLLIHCHAGVSRSSAALLVLMARAEPERNAQRAMDELLQICPWGLPNVSVVEEGDRLLGYHGKLQDVVTLYYDSLRAGANVT